MAAIGGWVSLVAAATWLMGRAGQHEPLCLFKRLTGVPCATCGSTRAAMDLLAGRPLAAWLCNPFVVTLGGLLAGILVLRLVAGRRLRLDLSRRQMRMVALAFVLALLANWAYVIAFVG